jgi:hypothetical protein
MERGEGYLKQGELLRMNIEYYSVLNFSMRKSLKSQDWGKCLLMENKIRLHQHHACLKSVERNT